MIVRDNGTRDARFTFPLKVARFHCYHVSVKIKTEDYTATPCITVFDSGQYLQYEDLGVERTQDWKEHHVIFNSLDHEDLSVIFCVQREGRGVLRWKDWKIEEAGLVNVLRREGTPCQVEGFTEGKDYERIEDPQLGLVPMEEPVSLGTKPPAAIKTRLPDGTKLRVSWYHPVIIFDDRVMLCLSDPKTMDLIRDQVRRMKAAWGAKGYMMGHDEIRAMNWDETCRKRNLTPGQILADNVRECAKLLSGSTVYVWDDMFDPYSNAGQSNYYFVRGNMTGSWEGLDKGCGRGELEFRGSRINRSSSSPIAATAS